MRPTPAALIICDRDVGAATVLGLWSGGFNTQLGAEILESWNRSLSAFCAFG